VSFVILQGVAQVGQELRVFAVEFQPYPQPCQVGRGRVWERGQTEREFIAAVAARMALGELPTKMGATTS
jgi:hypothetical protein